MGWLRDAILQRADIVEVVSEYLPLKKKGANYWALSPFKPEKTPSFAVSPTKQIFKCFASGKGGDVIRFVMEMEGLSYNEALRKLAEKYDIPLTETPSKANAASRDRQRYLALYNEAMRFYQERLPGSPAESYLSRRGVSQQMIEAFQLGYAPPEGSVLTAHLLHLGYPEEALIMAGLSARSEQTGRLYDRFRGRVIFPIQDEQGAVIAFAGRALGDEHPKYLNSPDTPFYQKSEILYGLHQARAALRKDNAALVVEGYMDVISLHQAGFSQAVATCGTALTPQHLQRLRRYTRRLSLLYDSDEAGQAATKRAIFSALSAGLFVYVVSLPQAKDPDELLQAHGVDALKAALAAQESWVSYLVRHSGTQPEQRYHLIQQLGEAIHSMPDPLLRRVYAEEIEKILNIPLDFWENFRTIETRAHAHTLRSHQEITAERELLRMAFTYPTISYGGIPIWELLQEELRHFRFSEQHAEMVRQVLCRWNGERPPSFSDIADELSPEAQDWLSEVLLEKYSLSPHWHTWDDSPLEEDPLAIVESNLNLLHLSHLQSLLEENLSILRTLSPEDTAYQEHLSLHQVLLRQRAELAQRSGLLLPYYREMSAESTIAESSQDLP